MGGGSSVPANTTSTTTVNQSPWQNPTYQALMLGTADKPGPVTSMLRASSALMDQYNATNREGLTPAAQASLGTWNPAVPGSSAAYVNQLNPATGQYVPTPNPSVAPVAAPAPQQQAAGGGIMSLRPGESRGFATGSTTTAAPKPPTIAASDTPAQINQKYADYTKAGGKLTAAQQAYVNNYAQNKTAIDAGNLKIASTGAISMTPVTSSMSGQQVGEIYKAGAGAGIQLTPAQNSFLSNYNTYSDKLNSGAYTIDPKTGMAMPTPAPQGETAAQKTARMNAYTKATGLALDANGVPTQATTAQLGAAGVSLGTTGQAPYGLTDTLGKTAYFDPTTGKSTLPDFLKLQEQARNLQTPEQFAQGSQDVQKAAQAMQARANYTPEQIRAQQITGTRYGATKMAAPQDIQAQGYDAAQAQAAQMAGPRDVQALQAQAAQMAAPQNIAAQQAQVATAAGPTDWTTAQANKYMNPYAETALAAQQRLANLNYAQQNNQLMSQAASQGAYGGSRAQLNLALNRLNQDIANQNLAAQGMNTAYNTGLSAFQGQNQLQQATNLANQQAYNTAYNNFVAQGMTAQQANLQAQLQVAQQNAANQQQANLANQTAGMTAQQANQQAALTTGQANLNAAQQTALANQAAQNTAMQQYINNALQAATTSYGGQLTAAQQNQVAQNAAAQFNAQQGQQANMANQQAALQAATQNQQAGLSANQQNLSALQGAAGAGAQLANIGTAQNQATLANLGALGQSAQAQQNLGQQYLNTQQQNAATWLGMPASINAPAANVINAQPVSGGSSSTVGTQAPATWGAAAGGRVEKGSWASGKPRQKDSWAYVSNKGRK